MQGSPTHNVLLLLFILSGGKTHGRIICKKNKHALLNMDRSVNYTTTNRLSRQFVRFCYRLNERNEPRERPIKRQHFSLPQFYARRNVLQHPYVIFLNLFYVIGHSCVKLKGVKVTLNVSSSLWTLRVPRRTTLALIFDGVSFCGWKKSTKETYFTFRIDVCQMTTIFLKSNWLLLFAFMRYCRSLNFPLSKQNDVISASAICLLLLLLPRPGTLPLS